MNEFLRETAQKIINLHKSDIQNICIVFPNKRTKIFFRKYYAEIIAKTDFSPDMKDLRQLVRNFTALNEPDKISLIFDLFDIFKKHSNFSDTNYSVDEFFKTGEIILNDFNEIDNWLINPEQIFRNIKNIKEIDLHFGDFDQEKLQFLKYFWGNFSPEKNSKEKEKFIQLWNILPLIYNDFKKHLLEKNTAYNGLMYRELCNLTDQNKINTKKYSKYIFVGFNALNNSETKIFKYFLQNQSAQFYWDTDTFYQNNEQNEAGVFLRKNFKELKQTNYPIPSNFTEIKKNIEIIGVPQHVAQAKILTQVFEKLNVKQNINKTAIVLADEKNLFPVLHSIPDYIQNINVSTGYPLKMTSLFDLIKKFCKLKADSFKNKSQLYNYKDVLLILRHPDVVNYEPEIVNKIINIIENENITNISSDFLTQNQNQILFEIFKPLSAENPSQNLLTSLLNILFLIFDKQRKSQTDEQNISQTAEFEYIHKSYIQIKKIREVLSEKNANLNLNLTIDLLMSVLQTQQIAFAGKAAEGLQLMGVLESRNLDFENLIILGVNEGNIPAVSSPVSFLSQSIRYAFGLPLIRHQDSVYAYLFYRMIQRAKNVVLVYNNLVNDSNSGEKSRFILQLIHETDLNITETTFKEDAHTVLKNEITIKNNIQIQESLKNYFKNINTYQKTLSPSAINTYIDCKLKFYFKYIAKIKPATTVLNEITPAAAGIIVHSAMEILYNKLFLNKKNKTVDKTDFDFLKQNIEHAVIEAFKKFYNAPAHASFVFENNMIIIKEVITDYINSILENDRKYSPFEIISLEADKQYITELPVNVNNTVENIKIGGVIDRVDKKNDLYRIIDYKTGSEKAQVNSISDLFNPEKQNRNTHILQTLIYSYIFSENNKNLSPKIIPSLFYIKNIHKHDYSPNITFNKQNINTELLNNILPELILMLTETISEMFSYETEFAQTKNEKLCVFCDFNLVCNK